MSNGWQDRNREHGRDGEERRKGKLQVASKINLLKNKKRKKKFSNEEQIIENKPVNNNIPFFFQFNFLQPGAD